MIRFTSGSLFKVISLCKSGRRYSDEKIAEMLFPNVEYTTNYIGHVKDCTKNLPDEITQYMSDTDQEEIIDTLNRAVRKVFLTVISSEKQPILIAAIQKILEQVPFVPAQNISFEKLKSFLIEVTEKDSTISSNFVLKMKIYRMIYDVALIRNDTETAIYIYDLISNEILQWDKEIFEYWFGDKESYLKRLQEYDKNRNCLLDNLKCNLDESKILKLHKYVFL